MLRVPGGKVELCEREEEALAVDGARAAPEASPTPFSRELRERLEVQHPTGVGDPSHKFIELQQLAGPVAFPA